jgi:hypothetical protein
MGIGTNHFFSKTIAVLGLCLAIGCGRSKPKSTDANLSKTSQNSAGEGAVKEAIDLSTFFWEEVDFTFIRPGTDDLKNAEATISIEIQATNAPSEVTWSLFYNKSFMSPEGGIAIIEDQPVTQTSAVWDTSTLERGTYFLFAVLKLQTTMTVRYFGSSIAIEKGGDENRTPFVSLAPGIEGVAYKAANVIPIKFLAADPDGDEISFTIEYSPDEGATWTAIASGLKRGSTSFVEDTTTGQLTYNLTVPAGLAVSSGYQLRVVASDGKKTGLGAVANRFGMIDNTDITYTSQMRGLVAAKCAAAGCHTSAPAAKALRLDYFDSPQLGAAQSQGFNSRRALILSKTRVDAAVPMPPPGSPALTEQERNFIELWTFAQGLGGPRNVAGSARPGAVTNTVVNPVAASVFTLDAVTATTIPITVDWTIDIPAGDTATYEVLVANSSDAFATWTLLSPPGLTATTYTWNVSRDTYTPSANGLARIRVVATTDKGRQNDRTVTTREITINPAP